MTDRTHPEAGSTHIIRYALELGLLWIDGDGRDKVREALDALDALEAKLASIGAGGVQALSAAPARPTVEQVEDEVSMGHGAWDMVDPQELIGAVLRLAASPTPPAEQQAEESCVKLLAECRDAFPIPEPGGPLEVQWSAAMERPEEVPEYVRLCVAEMQAAAKAAPVKTCVCGEPQASGTVHRVDGPCYVAAPQQEAQEPATVPYQKLTNEIDLILSDPDTELSIGAKRALLWMRTWVSVPLYTTPQPAPATQQAGLALSDDLRDRLVAISEAVADQDDRAAQAMLREILKAPQPSPTAQTDSVPAIQGEMNVQLDIDSNHSAPGQQRDVARSVALGQPMGNGQDQAAGRPSAQGDKLLTVAERNIRSFLRSAQFKSESDREAALSCVDVLWEAARASADSVKEDAARYRWLRATTNYVTSNGERIDVRNMPEKWDAAIDAALAAQKGKE